MDASRASWSERIYPRLYEWYFTRTPLGRVLRERENALIFAALEDLVGREDVLLDAGCGTGQYTLPLARRAQRVVALDPSSSMLDYLRRRLADERVANVEVRHGRVPDDLDHHQAFDGVVMIGVLNYVPTLGPTLEAFARVLRPGGWALFTVVPPSLEGRVHRLTDRLAGSRVYLHPTSDVLAAARRPGLEARHLGTSGVTRGGIDSVFVARRPG